MSMLKGLFDKEARRRDRVFVDRTGALWVEFASSGKTKQLHCLATFPRGFDLRRQPGDNGGWVLAAFKDSSNKLIEIDVFDSEAAAVRARTLVVDAIDPRSNGWTGFGAKLARILLKTALIVVAVGAVGAGALAGIGYFATGTQPGAQSVTSSNAPTPAEMGPAAKRINTSAIPNDQTIAVGTAGKPKIWVFLDPLCDVCQQADKEVLPLLQADFDIRIVPVPAKGKESATLIAQAFCAKDQVDGWRKAIAGKPAELASRDKAVLTQCVTRAMTNYVSMRNAGLDATPTWVAPDGRVLVGFITAPEVRIFAGVQR